MNLKTLSIALVATFVVVSCGVVALLFILGGSELFWYLRVNLMEAFGLGIAGTALLFFFIRLVWRLHALPLGISILFFILGVGMFVSVSFGSLYTFQYPVFVNSFGPGQGPGLPFKNIVAFFQHIDEFERIADIARDPNEVPPPITVQSDAVDELSTSTIASASTATTSEAQGREVEIFLETKEVLSELGPDIVFNYWTFNDKVPGPLLRVREGDTVKLTIHNNESSLHPHNIDLHAATGPGGGGAVTMVSPGETKTFTFKALNPGLFVYHCATPNMAVHMAHGMYGLILVEPKEGLPKVDKEFYIMQGEFYSTGVLGRKGLQVFDARKMLDGRPEYVVFNGKTGALTDTMQVEVGQKVRMYVGNGGVANTSSFHLVGEIFDTVYPEASMGGSLLKNVQTTNIPAGGATIVEFTVDYPGTYVLVDHALMRTDKGAWGKLIVTGKADPKIFNGDFSSVKEHPH
jgi:nitrite reductase (NO-forming)